MVPDVHSVGDSLQVASLVMFMHSAARPLVGKPSSVKTGKVPGAVGAASLSRSASMNRKSCVLGCERSSAIEQAPAKLVSSMLIKRRLVRTTATVSATVNGRPVDVAELGPQAASR